MSKSPTSARVEPRLQLLPGIGLVDLNHPELTERLAGIAAAQLEQFQARMRDGLLAASVAVGLGVLGEFLAAEVTEKAGPKGRHDPQRTASRHGSERATVPLGGRRVPIDKPRLRAADGSGEVRLDTWDAVQAVDLLSEHMVAAALAGVSTRSYQHAALEAVGELAARSTAKSTVSARFVAATRARLDELRNRDLSGRRWLVVYVDGFEFAGQMMVGALGVDAEGNKAPLGIIQGTTENKTVCRDLLTKAVERGLDATGGLLFVLDGAKALHAAVRDVFDGQPVQVQRCRRHKSENVVGYLPAAEKGWVRRKLTAAWAEPDPTEARAALQELARKLDRLNPDAAASLREGLEETITINRLGIGGTLGKTLATTNPMESSIDIVKSHARNVKNWNADRRGHRERPADMRLRWAAAGLLAAEAQYRRVKGHRQLPALAAALQPRTLDRPEAVAYAHPARPTCPKFHGEPGNLLRPSARAMVGCRPPERHRVGLAADAPRIKRAYGRCMFGTAKRRRLSSFAIPTALAVTGTLEYLFEDVGAEPRQTLPFLYLAVVLLYVRRAIPFAGPLAALAVLTIESFVLGGRPVADPATTLFLAFYCLFMLAAYNDESRAAVGAVLGLVGVALMTSNKPGSDVLWTLFVCALLMVGWGCGLVYGRRERHALTLETRGAHLEAEAANAVSAERARIAREIHDIVSHSVSVIVLQARGGRRVLDDAPDDARQAFDSIETAGEQALVELRRLLGIIRDDGEQPALSPQPGLGGLEALLTQVRGAGLPVALSIEGAPTPLPAGVDLAAYRVIQEGLTNALKHAGDARASVTVRYAPTEVAVEVSDDGNGADSGGKGGRGLVGMRERVGIYGGTLYSGNRPGGGYALSVLLPLAAAPR